MPNSTGGFVWARLALLCVVRFFSSPFVHIYCPTAPLTTVATPCRWPARLGSRLQLLLLFGGMFSICADGPLPTIAQDSSQGLDQWHPRNALGDVTCVSSIEGAVLGFAGKGLAIRTTDGLGWECVDTGQTNTIRGTVAGLGLHVAVGENGTILTSSNGLSWTPQISGVTSRLWSGTFWKGDFVVVGDDSTILISTNALDWKPQPSPISDTLRGIASDGTNLVAMARGGLFLTSTNGSEWTTHSGSVSNRWLYGLTYGAGQFVAVGTNGTILVSPDGATWTQRHFGGPTLATVAFGDNRFVAAGVLKGTNAVLFTSTNAVDWEELPGGPNRKLASISFHQGAFFAGGADGVLGQWTDGGWETMILPGAAELRGVIFADGKFVAAGSQRVYVSPDGKAWRGYPAPLLPSGFLMVSGCPVAYGNGKFLIVGRSGATATSSDFVRWESA